MRDRAVQDLADLLEGVGGREAFSARRSTPADGMPIEVVGVGPLTMPLPASQIRELVAIARPARFGLAEHTLTDRRVRDTCEVPKSRVRIDPRWRKETLVPMLDRIRSDLGIPRSCGLRAELHSFLVYGPGQFFLPHRDSEKSDGMVATLSLTLPGRSTGGGLVIEHSGVRRTYRPSPEALTFVAFYADCTHEVRPVRTGHRVVLTFNLVLTGDSMASTVVESTLVAAIAGAMGRHFADHQRLVFLLDHQYTESALDFARLKGADAARVAALTAAADREEAEVALAWADIHQTSDATPAYDYRDGWVGRYTDHDDDSYDDEVGDDDADDVVPGELLDEEIELTWWVDRSGRPAESIASRVIEDETSTGTPTSALTPTDSSYEGYMGNYGNTIDRWYRRGAVLIWPRRLDFAVRAELSPRWAIETLAALIDDGELGRARAHAESVSEMWASTSPDPVPILAAYAVAEALDEPRLGAAFLRPYRLESLRSSHGPKLVALDRRYGEAWLAGVIRGWESASPRWETVERRAWIGGLGELVASLNHAGGQSVSRHILALSWTWLCGVLGETRRVSRPSERSNRMAELSPAVAAQLRASLDSEVMDLCEAMLDVLASPDLLDFALAVLQDLLAEPADLRHRASLFPLIEQVTRRLGADLAVPARAPEDWSIDLPDGCSCELCDDLEAFLNDPTRTSTKLPLKKESRQHLHVRIDQHELPLSHLTQRSGRPFTLVLRKLPLLFVREAAERQTKEAELERLVELRDSAFDPSLLRSWPRGSGDGPGSR